MATTPYPFVAGSVLTASQLNSTFNIPTTTKTASYTLTAADAGTRIYMNSASATTITVNTSIFAASDVVEIFNIGAGVTTITAGTATVSSAGPLAVPQYGSGRLTFTATGASIYTPSGVTTTTSGLTLITAQTIGTTVSSVTVSNAFSATYENYRIIVTGGVGSTTTSLTLILGSTTTGYYEGIVRIALTQGDSTADFKGNNNGSAWDFAGEATADGINSVIELQQPFATKRTTMQIGYSSIRTNGNAFAGAGYLNNATSYTAFTYTPVTGTLTGGTIFVYGYKLS